MHKTIEYPLYEDNYLINLSGLSEKFENIFLLDSNSKSNDRIQSSFSKLLALGSSEELVLNESNFSFEKINNFISKKTDWAFGYLSYDVKNQIENLYSKNHDGLKFPLVHIFIPKIVLMFLNDKIQIYYDDNIVSISEIQEVYTLSILKSKKTQKLHSQLNIKSKISKEEYLVAIEKIKKQIRIGNLYELNFCQEFFVENAVIDPSNIFHELNNLSQSPFSTYCKLNNLYLISSSPERFLKKSNTVLISQPIKGTAKRSNISKDDKDQMILLRNDPKEISENIMIVDIVRNDFSKIAESGSVIVDELLEVYSFKQVHQLVSTISCKIKQETSFVDLIKATFPMGSMTGAPKISAMKLIEEFESSKRGIYSGALGYFTPSGDFDFSVIIRSILYNFENKYLSFMVGSAITEKSIPENEYQECLLKANAIIKVLQNI